MHCLKYRGPC